MAWWTGNKLRLVQNNLRETDADLDADLLVKELKEFGANMLMMNAGGIFAFYPSKLQYQYVTPYLKKDLLAETIEKAHANDIRFIARFDFSKAHESIFEARPEWFYRTKSGGEVNYFGIVHTCLNGGYQQRYSLDILEEVLTGYDVDGVFFNMFGYQNWDYSGNYYGICYCGNCRKRFMDMYGLELPHNEDKRSERYVAYRKFQEETAMYILDTIHGHIKRLKPEVAICTYHPHKVDIVRHESNTALGRPHPKWLYSAAENVMPIAGSYRDKLTSNCSINAIDLTYRFTGVSAYETEIRLYENIANGSGLDFCIIGAFEGYPDQANMEKAKNVFRFHQEREALFGQFLSEADVVLVKPSASMRDARQEYLGVFKMLKEEHMLFDVVLQERLPHIAGTGAKVVVLPGIEALTDEELGVLTGLRGRGVHIAATGGALAGCREALASLFDAEQDGGMEDTTAAYVRVDDKAMFPALSKREWVIVNGRFAFMRYGGDAEKMLPMVAPSTFGPPERAYGHELTERYGLGFTDAAEGRGRGAYIAWNVGELYYRHGFADHKQIAAGVIDKLLGGDRRLTTNAHPSVEMTFHGLPDGTYLLQLINLSGFNGVTYEAPIPMSGILTELTGIRGLSKADNLNGGGEARIEERDGRIIVRLAELHTYGAYHLR
ncbi:family 10 glycosylhydrolase [Paenibacillus arenilitoris]|uniref:Family 10 glycosylhydrolase n=1 Tax=Paenibacillus arenilitoris TaxID=2772299 RepID=A0A927H6D1_9BACL|nr:family 10 glycosylhydrolase [Paenibacillus arenilitoris]MBD2869448.1 family 10 glycosylhydrolase [Paenibacillus arenilitoris]